MKKLFLIFFGLVFFLSFIFSLLIYKFIVKELPPIEMIEGYKPPVSTQIIDDEGNVIFEYYFEKRKYVKLNDISPYVIKTFITLEDKKFFKHFGIDPLRLLKATYNNLISRRFVEGASTITQQLARNMFLTMEKTINRKLKELVLALIIESKFSKDEILEKYLNQINFGNGVYGIETASLYYLDKKAKDLTLSESAFLAAIPRSPTYYNPYTNFENTIKRQKKILNLLFKNKVITKEEYEKALKEKIVLKPKESLKKRFAAYYLEEIRKYIEGAYGEDFIYKEGIKIYTSLNSNIQKVCENVVDSLIGIIEKGVRRKGKNDTLPLQIAVVAIENKTGEIKALIGGRDFFKSQFNRAIQAKRHIGSAFKPFYYLAAIENGYLPTDYLYDLPVTIEDDGSGKPWYPGNFDGKFMGRVTLRQALAHSRNLASVRLLQEVGTSTAIEYARKLGIESYVPNVLSISLGAAELTPLEVTHAYSTIANYGKKMDLIMIKKIEDVYGNIIFERKPSGKQVIDSQSVYILIHMMKSVMNNGTGVEARTKYGFYLPCAGKTGTTDNFTDAWFIGFVPEITIGVWVGFDSLRTIAYNASGALFALPFWTEIMKRLPLKGEDFKIPSGIVIDTVCVESNLKRTPYCPKVREEVFIKGTEPGNFCNIHTKEKGGDTKRRIEF
ncbi:MAG: PBP1A family penicillin-binding protein [candidate division WOR-3 bacterium]